MATEAAAKIGRLPELDDPAMVVPGLIEWVEKASGIPNNPTSEAESQFLAHLGRIESVLDAGWQHCSDDLTLADATLRELVADVCAAYSVDSLCRPRMFVSVKAKHYPKLPGVEVVRSNRMAFQAGLSGEWAGRLADALTLLRRHSTPKTSSVAEGNNDNTQVNQVDHAIALLAKIGRNKAKIAREVGVPRTSMEGKKWERFNQIYDSLG